MSTTTVCYACGKAIQTLYYMECSKCNKLYDNDCLAISVSSFEHQTKLFKESWVCPQCVCSRPKQGNSGTPIRNMSMNNSFNHEHVNTVRGTRGSQKSVEATPTTTEITELMKEIKELRQEMATVKQQNSEISLLRKDVQDLKTELSNLNTCITKNFKDFQKQLDDKDIEIFHLKKSVSDHQSSFNLQEQLSLKNELEIQGIQEEKTESLTHILLTLSQRLSVELQETDINSIYKADLKNNLNTKKTQQPRPIVVELTRKAKKDELLLAARVRKNLISDYVHPALPATKIYLNERLTKANRLLFREARNRASLHGFRYCWLRNGSIFARKAENSGTEKHPAILMPEDLDKLGLPQNPDSVNMS